MSTRIKDLTAAVSPAVDDYVAIDGATNGTRKMLVSDISPTIPEATTAAAGLMSATDKGRLDDLYEDYSDAMAALGV